MTIAIGDTVTWRSGLSRLRELGKGGLPIGIANCEVLGFGQSTDGKAAALLRLPKLPGWPETAGALVADLEKGNA